MFIYCTGSETSPRSKSFNHYDAADSLDEVTSSLDLLSIARARLELASEEAVKENDKGIRVDDEVAGLEQNLSGEFHKLENNGSSLDLR